MTEEKNKELSEKELDEVSGGINDLFDYDKPKLMYD
jgi:bacteriocin-like protein